MAPALTQTVDPPNLADATRHSPPPKPATSSTSLYDHLKEHRNKRKLDINAILLSGQTLITNGDCVPPELAPPACGQAEGRPAPTNSPYQPNMDGHLSLPVDNLHTVTQLPVSSITPSVDSIMGLQSCITNITVASDPVVNEKGSEATTSSSGLEDTPVMLGNQNELLALVGRDFNNVNDIIDTLQRLASNPELLDAAARDLEPDNGSHCNSQILSPEERAAHILAKLTERQNRLENRRLFLLRRLHRITSRGLGMTISNQVCHLIRHSRSMLEKELTRNPECETAEANVGIGTLPTASLKSLSNLACRVDASQNIHKTNTIEKQMPAADVLTFSTSVKSQLDTVTANMKAAALGHVHHDSDATESSSGGESCDEVESFYKSSTDYKPIKERAYYRYCRTRGWVASKWMWLDAQIADLDSKINQQEQLYSSIRTSKNTVMLSSESVSAQQRQPVRSPAHFDMQDPALTCIVSPSSVRSTLNGYHPTNKVDDLPLLHGLNGGVHDNGGSARTVGVQKVKRRRYVRPNMSMIMKRSLGAGGTTKSANKYRDKVSTVLCKCVPPLSCILCVKSYFSNRNVYYGNHILNSNKSKVLALLTHPAPESLAKLDSAFHPVLSEMTELLQSEYYKATIGSFEWQHKTLQGKSTIAHLPRKELPVNRSDHDEEPDCLEPHLKKRRKDFKKNGKKFREDVKEKLTSYMHRSTRRGRALLEDYEDEYGAWHVSVSSTNSSPCPSPAPYDKADRLTKIDKLHSDYKEGSGRILRKHAVTSTPTPSTPTSTVPTLTSAYKHKANVASNSYDINNIVIPYNMAASARVELLKYKEIPTPKWRIEEIKPVSASKKNRDELEEDISEDAITARHSRSEAMERKKFLHYLQWQVNSTRSSRSRRTDSSGTNTPDHPLSPRVMEQEHGESSPIGSPPSTPPAGPSEDSNHSLPRTSAVSKSQATVLTLSLSSLQSSLLDSNPSHNSSSEPINKHLINQASYSEDVEPCDADFAPVSPPLFSTAQSTSVVQLNFASTSKELNTTNSFSEVQPGSCAERFVSGNGIEKRTRVISITLGDEPNERDQISPFPCRDFPLTENDYQDLVIEDLSDVNSPSEVIKPHESEGIETDMEESQIVIVDLNKGDLFESTGDVTNMKSGRDSPLSELTDSAPEEDGVWDDEATPDWTISAVHDRSGGMVLQVQKN